MQYITGWHGLSVLLLAFYSADDLLLRTNILKSSNWKGKALKNAQKYLVLVSSSIFLPFRRHLNEWSDSNFEGVWKINTNSAKYDGSVWRKIFLRLSNLFFPLLCCVGGSNSQSDLHYTLLCSQCCCDTGLCIENVVFLMIQKLIIK